MGHRPTYLVLLSLAALGVSAPGVAAARCAAGSLSVWPAPSELLPANGHIALEGYGTDQDLVRSIAGRSPRLLSGRRSIPLRVVEIQEGGFRITQAILAPERPLEPGRRYVLRVNGRRRIPVWNGTRSVPAAWTAAAADRTAPVWEGPPTVGASSYQALGCGPSIHVSVAVPIRESGPVRVRVRLDPIAGGAGRTYDVSSVDGGLAIGHGMCSGAFDLAPGARYRVTLAAIDAAGNSTPAPGGPLTITGPAPPAGSPGP